MTKIITCVITSLIFTSLSHSPTLLLISPSLPPSSLSPPVLSLPRSLSPSFFPLLTLPPPSLSPSFPPFLPASLLPFLPTSLPPSSRVLHVETTGELEELRRNNSVSFLLIHDQDVDRDWQRTFTKTAREKALVAKFAYTTNPDIIMASTRPCFKADQYYNLERTNYLYKAEALTGIAY